MNKMFLLRFHELGKNNFTNRKYFCKTFKFESSSFAYRFSWLESGEKKKIRKCQKWKFNRLENRMVGENLSGKINWHERRANYLESSSLDFTLPLERSLSAGDKIFYLINNQLFYAPENSADAATLTPREQ